MRKIQSCVLMGQAWVESTVWEFMNEDQGRFGVQYFTFAKEKMLLF